ncbi:MAG: hypothetical protein ACOYXR_04670 [Nitrospirota bacterium]
MKPRKPSRVPGRGGSKSPRPAPSSRPAASKRLPALSAEVRALRLDMERASGQTKDMIRKLERLALMVGELRDAVADLQASLGDGDVEYGAVDDTDSEMGEGHA